MQSRASWYPHKATGVGYFHIYPGSSKCVKIVPFHPKKPTKRQTFYISGISRYIYIYIYLYMWASSAFPSRQCNLAPNAQIINDFSQGIIGKSNQKTGNIRKLEFLCWAPDRWYSKNSGLKWVEVSLWPGTDDASPAFSDSLGAGEPSGGFTSNRFFGG